jgi:hypothetical protein
MKVTIKPVRFTDKKQVFHDGVLYATYVFVRTRNIVMKGHSRVLNVASDGEVKYADGRTADLSFYSWAADVARDFRNGSL